MRAAEATLSALWTLGLGQCGEATTIFGGLDQVPLIEQATRLEFAGGVTVSVRPPLGFYAQAGYPFAVAPSDARRDGFKGDIGLRYTW